MTMSSVSFIVYHLRNVSSQCASRWQYAHNHRRPNVQPQAVLTLREKATPVWLSLTFFLYFLSRISRTVKENKAVNFSLVCVFSFQFSLMYLVCSFQFCFYLYNRW